MIRLSFLNAVRTVYILAGHSAAAGCASISTIPASREAALRMKTARTSSEKNVKQTGEGIR